MAALKQTITDAEYEIMKVLWDSPDMVTVSDVVARLSDNEWSASTVSTFLQRLLRKGVISCEKRGKANLYYPLLSRDEYDICETQSFLSKIYKGSVKNLVAAMYQNKKLTDEDLSELREMFELK